jgi:hypothetical protein
MRESQTNNIMPLYVYSLDMLQIRHAAMVARVTWIIEIPNLLIMYMLQSNTCVTDIHVSE